MKLSTLILLYCFGLSCTQQPGRTSTAKEGSASSNTVLASTHSENDTRSITRFLRSQGAILDTVLASQGSLTVAVASRDSTPVLITLVHDSTGVQQLGSDINIAGLSYPSVEIVSLNADEVLRVTTFNDLVEDVVGTAVDRIGPDGMHREFADPTFGCKAAVFASSRGTYTLRTYTHSPFDNDCLSPCAEALRSATGTEPAEVGVLERINGKWRQVTPDSKASIVRGHLAVAAVVHDGRVPECARDSTRILDAIAQWR